MVRIFFLIYNLPKNFLGWSKIEKFATIVQKWLFVIFDILIVEVWNKNDR